jgi:hypothetical protein
MMRNGLGQLLTEFGNVVFVPTQTCDRTIWAP